MPGLPRRCHQAYASRPGPCVRARARARARQARGCRTAAQLRRNHLRLGGGAPVARRGPIRRRPQESGLYQCRPPGERRVRLAVLAGRRLHGAYQRRLPGRRVRGCRGLPPGRLLHGANQRRVPARLRELPPPVPARPRRVQAGRNRRRAALPLPGRRPAPVPGPRRLPVNAREPRRNGANLPEPRREPPKPARERPVPLPGRPERPKGRRREPARPMRRRPEPVPGDRKAAPRRRPVPDPGRSGTRRPLPFWPG